MIEGDRHSPKRGKTRGTRGRGAAQRWRHRKGASHTGNTEQGRQEAERGGRCTESGATRREHKREAEGRGRQNGESQVSMRAAQRQHPHPQPVPRPQGNHDCRIPKALPCLRVKDNRLPAPPSPHPADYFGTGDWCTGKAGEGKGRRLKMSLYPLLDSAGRDTN